jgi:uncharacterized Zn-binding protein involved in type VI secretion
MMATVRGGASATLSEGLTMPFPASRVSDLHLCPSFTILVPHVGGPIAPPGSPSVLIGGLLAARVTDPAVCVGPPDSVASGAATVLASGLPLAHVRSQCLHGGLVIVGNPSVQVGGPDAKFRFNLRGTPAQIAQMQEALAVLYSTPNGRELIARLAATGHVVNIRITTGGSRATPAPSLWGGTDTTIEWNPNQRLEGLPADARGGAMVLGHEAIHALHNAEDTHGNGPRETHPGQTGSSSRGEERQTVGSAPPYDAAGNPVTDANGQPAGTHVRQPDGTLVPGTDHSGDSPTENALRDDLGLPRRPTYYPSTWPGGAPW